MVFFDKIDDVIYDNGLKIKILAPCKVWYSGQQQWQKINRWKSMGEHEKHTETTTDCEKRSMSPYRFRTSRNKIAQKQIEKCQEQVLQKLAQIPPLSWHRSSPSCVCTKKNLISLFGQMPRNCVYTVFFLCMHPEDLYYLYHQLVYSSREPLRGHLDHWFNQGCAFGQRGRRPQH